MNNRYQSAQFFISVQDLKQLPPDEGREVAFVGRSNVGKSSALNVITGQKSLARISKTPGRTQLINFFQIADGRCLVDLPGYGYAKVPEAMRRRWQQTLGGYLQQRNALRGLFLLMDVRHPLTELDQQMLDWCQHYAVASHILLTKADKLKRGAAHSALLQVQKTLQQRYSDNLVSAQSSAQFSVQLFSSLKRSGVEQARARLDAWLYDDQDNA